jgi:Holliday junction resolvase
MAGGRSPKRKGTRVERELVNLLLELGFVCSRVPLSGAAGGAWSGDIHLELLGRILKVEVKARREFATLHRWIAKADLLLLKADRQPALVVLPLALLAELKPAGTELAHINADLEALE